MIEAMVAAMLLGIGVVVGITAWNTATLGAKEATRKAWATCVGRSEMEAVLATSGSGVPNPLPSNVSVQVSPAASPTTLLTVTVTVKDPELHTPVYTVAALKSAILAVGPTPDTSRIAAGCPSP
jgi:hypothetical protein